MFVFYNLVRCNYKPSTNRVSNNKRKKGRFSFTFLILNYLSDTHPHTRAIEKVKTRPVKKTT